METAAERILMVTNTPWTADLGGARVFVELSAEFAALGCRVERFSAEDAFPNDFTGPPGRRRPLAYLRGRLHWRPDFGRRALAFLRREARRFDIVDAMQADLPYSKQQLGIDGLLVSRSVGLFFSYHEFNVFAARRWPDRMLARWLFDRLLSGPSYRRGLRNYLIGFRSADLINVSNSDDLSTVTGPLGFPGKTVMFPFGLSAQRSRAFEVAQRAPEERLAAQSVAFVGTWNSRKGSRDWPRILSEVLAARPGTRFLFLGTDLGPSVVLRDFPGSVHAAIQVRPRFVGSELPEILGSATVGAFPGYLEGFGFAVLEMLAAGLPTVAYDSPGPREMLRLQSIPTSVPTGDTTAFSKRLIDLLALTPGRYAEIAADGRRVAAQFSWRRIAEKTLSCYRDALARLDARCR